MNKITKLLSVFVIAGAIGTSIAGVAGCKKGGGNDNNNGHTHNYTCVDNEDGATHTATCSVDGCDAPVISNQQHTDADNNDICDKCEGDIYSVDPNAVQSITITSATKLKVGDNLTLEATVTPSTASQEVTWSIESGDTYADLNGDVLTGKAAGDVTVKATSKTDPTKSKTATINVSEKSEYDKLMALDSKIVTDTEYTVGAKLTEDTTKGIYVVAEEGAADRGEYVEVKEEAGSKVFAQVNPGVKNTNKNISTIINFGHVKTYVEGYFETKITKISSSGEKFIVFKNGDTAALTITAAGSKLSYTVGSGTATEITGATFALNAYVAVYYKFDLAAGTTTLKVGDATNLVTALDNVDTGITAVSNVTLSSSNSGQRVQTTKNIVARGELMTAAEYATVVNSNFAAYKTEATTDDVLTLTSDTIDAAVTSAQEAITTAGNTSYAAVDAKYEEEKTKLDGLILAQAKISAEEILTSYRGDESFTGDNATQLQEKKTAGINEIKKAETTTIELVKKALAAAQDDCDTVLNDTEANKADVLITIKDSTDTALNATPWNKKDGDKVTKTELDALFTIDATKKVVGYYTTLTSGVLSGEIDFGTDGYVLLAKEESGSKVDTPLTLYAKIEDKTEVTKTLNSTNWGSGVLIAADTDDEKAIGTDTGFYACGNGTGAKVIEIGEQKTDTAQEAKTPCIKLNGSLAVKKNAISIECAAGSVTVVVKYFHASNAGRYVDVRDAAGNVVGTGETTPTVENGPIQTATMTFTLDEAGKIYIGSHSSGLYLTEITVTYSV